MKVQCIKCNEEKELDQFSKNPKKSLGINKICKICHSKYRKVHYIENKEKELAQVRLYQASSNYSKKAGRVIERVCPNCGDKVFLTKAEEKKDFVRYCSKSCRSVKNKSDYYNYLYDIQRRSKKLNKEFNLTEEFIKDLLEDKQQNRCAATNLPIFIRNSKKEATLHDTASLDRIDSSKGYTEDNVQWVALGINYMKLDFTKDELHIMLKLIKENYTSLA